MGYLAPGRHSAITARNSQCVGLSFITRGGGLVARVRGPSLLGLLWTFWVDVYCGWKMVVWGSPRCGGDCFRVVTSMFCDMPRTTELLRTPPPESKPCNKTRSSHVFTGIVRVSHPRGQEDLGARADWRYSTKTKSSWRGATGRVSWGIAYAP